VKSTKERARRKRGQKRAGAVRPKANLWQERSGGTGDRGPGPKEQLRKAQRNYTAVADALEAERERIERLEKGEKSS